MGLTLISHFYNEELLLEDWINWHSGIFSSGLLIDHGSTDKSTEIALSCMPLGWNLVQSKLDCFDARLTDQEVMEYEKLISGWKMTLNTTEYMFTPNLEEKLNEWIEIDPSVQAFGAQSFCLVDIEAGLPLTSPTIKNRNHGFLDEGKTRRYRYLHNQSNGQYGTGRHTTSLSHVTVSDFTICHLTYSPWDQCKKRKLQIQDRIPQRDKDGRLGFEHLVTEQQLEERRNSALCFSHDLFNVPLYLNQYEELFGYGSQDN